MVPAINSGDYLKPQREKRRIKAKQFSDYQCSNIVEKNVTNNSRCFIVDNFRTDQFRHSFFIDSVIKRNHLPDSIVHADSVESFKSALLKRDFAVNIPGLVLLRTCTDTDRKINALLHLSLRVEKW